VNRYQIQHALDARDDNEGSARANPRKWGSLTQRSPRPAASRDLVRENDAGEVAIEYRGVPLEARAFPKDARGRQGEIG
jgi:hypothetical protein